VREPAEEIGPAIVRDSILVALRDVSVGVKDFEPDESPLVRHSAAEVLTRVGSPVAQEGAIARLSGGIDPLERDPDVRCALVAYLGAVGGPGAFEACVERLADIDLSVRLYAQTSLQQLTHERVDPTPGAWRAWAEKAPALAKAGG
jgi:HEAT repeat protein